MDKDSILRNYKLAVLFEQSESRSWVFIKDEAELKRMVSDNEVNGGDVIIKLTAETVRVVVENNFLELK